MGSSDWFVCWRVFSCVCNGCIVSMARTTLTGVSRVLSSEVIGNARSAGSCVGRGHLPWRAHTDKGFIDILGWRVARSRTVQNVDERNENGQGEPDVLFHLYLDARINRRSTTKLVEICWFAGERIHRARSGNDRSVNGRQGAGERLHRNECVTAAFWNAIKGPACPRTPRRCRDIAWGTLGRRRGGTSDEPEDDEGKCNNHNELHLY
jgi:hypothetical protein